MNKKEIMDILNILKTNYSTFNNVEEKFKYWEETLSQYDFEDVKNKISELMQRKEFLTTCPTLFTIVAPLKKVKEKVEINDNSYKYDCMFCRKILNSYEEMVEHEDRCRSIKYIERQYNKYNLGILNKKELYTMNEEEFINKYKRFLQIIVDKTTDDIEKEYIKLYLKS